MSSDDLPGTDTSPTKELPQPLATLRYSDPQNVRGEETTYYVLGTAHVSAQSCRDAADLIARVRPQIVLLELCVERKALLSTAQPKEHSFGEALADIRAGRGTPFQALYSWLLSRVAANLEIMPGEEFRVALQSAKSIGAQVVLGDRLLSVTLARVWGALSCWEKVRLAANLSWAGFSLMDAETMKQEIEAMKETDVLTEAVKEFGKHFPGLVGPLLTERDQYMVYVMRRLASQASSVVAVVGAGHLQGIRDHWETPIDIQALMEVPTRRPRGQRLWRVGALTGAVLAVTLVVRYSLKRRA